MLVWQNSGMAPVVKVALTSVEKAHDGENIVKKYLGGQVTGPSMGRISFLNGSSRRGAGPHRLIPLSLQLLSALAIPIFPVYGFP